ncbi:MAG: HEAT repeat domain-containing protein [Planctomycetaceae bacterium]|nr:HEAT repeat domain-containing protein [Planctomycetaceae bacterium]
MTNLSSLLWRTVALLAAIVVLFAPARALDDEIVGEFKKYFKQYKDSATRVEAVLSLEGTESPAVVDALLPILKMVEDPDVVRAGVRVLSKFKTDEPKAALFAAIEAQKDEAVRSGLLQAAAAGKYTGANEALKKVLVDKSWDLRRRAIDALVASSDATVVDAIAPLCADAEPAVRCSALEGLAALKSELVLKPAVDNLAHEVWQVRVSAITALRKVRHRDSIEPLIARLALEQGRLQLDVGDALNEITGRSFGTRLELWKQFWDAYKDRFQIPTDAELAKLRAKQKEEAAKYKPEKGGTSYHGIETPSRRIMFVIDVSGSMENLVVEKERFEDGGYPSLLRIDICKTELIRTIESLEGYVDFNIIAFATEVKPWKKDLVKANVVNKSAAVDWVRKLAALGGASKEDLAQAGLTASANLEAGKTNTYGALSTALGAAGRGTKDKNYECAIDTIFFLSDGRPTVGEYVDPQDVAREIREVNKLRKVVIHTIAIGEFQKDFMKLLADQNGGIFVDLGR